MIYNPKTLDPIHKEALNHTTELLQVFMERQEELRQLSKQASEWNYERNSNVLIITCIRWIRYFLWGNSPEVVRIKTKSLNRWCWNNTISGPKISPWVADVLKIDKDELDYYGFITYKKLINHLIDIIIPKRTDGLFGLMDGDYGSVTLEDCVRNMKKEMGVNYDTIC